MDHATAMRAAIDEGEKARGRTGDNPWVGSVIVLAGEIVARGHTQGPGEDHAEIGALHEARDRGVDLAQATLYSTLEPCAFHGRTPACARVIAGSGVRLVVTGIRDPHPRVDGAGVAMVREAGIDVVEDVEADAIRRQIGPWIVKYHPHEPLRRARAWGVVERNALARELARLYAIDDATADDLAQRALLP
jgi:diaminohydroxyphosphoribosylaminopyrimidine deaminase/5-amino-6-(5-phosphoribosylamino)uracil reductase